MRFLLIGCFLLVWIFQAFSQDMDTLRHLSSEDSLTVFKYEGSNQWGYLTGHNHLGRQEYAEKYFVEGSAKVTGIISHHKGVVQNKKNVGAFIIYSVDEKGMPGDILNRKQWYFGDLDLSGGAQVTELSTSVEVVDSFFVSFDLTDYSHGGFDGDTIALMTGLEDSRDESDLAIWGRNVTRFHNHSTPDFRDFYYQNGTPIATHFAIYPIVEFDIMTSAQESNYDFIGNGHLKLYPPYPNPARELFNLKYSQVKSSRVSMRLYDINGRMLLSKDFGMRPAGDYMESIDIDNFTAGTYIYTVSTDAVKLAGTLVVK